MINRSIRLLGLVLYCLSGCTYFQGHSETRTFIIADLLRDKKTVICGQPRLVASPYGEAVLFDGRRDGLFFDNMPLQGLKEFTLQLRIRIDSGATAEQRYIHFGEVHGDRVLLEMRGSPQGWFMDGFVQSRGSYAALMAPQKLHRFGRWHQLSFVVADGRQETYVDGQLQLAAKEPFEPLTTGETSIGVRQNKISWFKGAIYDIKIIPSVTKF